mmetsp:Transcript_76403/g.211025  ORF Transcript_76403/g.211025 Transcript_76403/m.211025 type:complete len:450 (-) Transcript_76403:62-1411(-)
MELATWDTLAQKAGAPTPRIFSASERLFGAEVAEFRFWHDAAGWCPSCAAVFMVLEEMQVPYVLSTSPLTGYLKPGETKPVEFLAIRPNGVLPVIQFARLRNTGDIDGEVVVHAFRILEALNARYPARACLPRTPARRACAESLAALAERLCYATEGGGSHADQIMDDVNVALGGGLFGHWSTNEERPWVAPLEHVRHSDDADGDEARFGGPLTAGPFLFGCRPCAVDLALLPWLSIRQARMPDGAFEARWPAAGRMLAAAREPGMCSCNSICFDKTTLRAMAWRGKPHLAPPPPTDVDALFMKAAGTAQPARRDAAARLCGNHAAIARFARTGFGMGASHRQLEGAAAGRAIEEAVDLGLRVTTAVLLSGSAEAAMRQGADQGVAAVRRTCGEGAARAAGSALVFLSWNVGVPRDLEPGPADALRAHAALVGVLLGAPSPAEVVSAAL